MADLGTFDAPASHIWRSNDDGKTWVPQPNHPFNGNIMGIPQGVAYGNGRFVMAASEYVPYSGSVHAAMSLDGETWTTSIVTGPRTAGIYQGGMTPGGAIFSGGVFLAPYGDPFESAPYKTLLSYNFTTHTATYSSFETAGGARQKVFRSVDGVTWEGPFEIWPSMKNPAAPDDNIFVAIDSTTGERVELPYYIPAPPDNTLSNFGYVVPYGPAKGPISSVAAGYFGIPPHASASLDKGVSWAPGGSLLMSAGGTCGYGNGVFLDLGTNLLDGSGPTLFGLFSSRDGLEYTFLGENNRVSAGISNQNAMAFGKKIFLLPARAGDLNSNAVAISKDNGRSWTPYKVPYAGGVAKVLY